MDKNKAKISKNINQFITKWVKIVWNEVKKWCGRGNKWHERGNK